MGLKFKNLNGTKLIGDNTYKFKQVSLTYIPRASVTGLGNSSPTSQTYTIDEGFPTSFFEVTDEYGDTFIKIPTMYRKVDSVVDNQITAFTIATGKVDDTYEPYSVFVKPDGTVMDYVLIGQYSTGSSYINSARSTAQAKGTGYQLYDWQFNKLYTDLCLVISQKVDFANSSTTSFNNLGVYYTGEYNFVDGVSRDGSTWVISYDPSKYTTPATASTSGYSAVTEYSAPSTQTYKSYIKKIGYSSTHPFFNFPSVVGGSKSTYYCDAYASNDVFSTYYSKSGVATIICDKSDYAGLWNCNSSYDHTRLGYARICYRPIDK